MSAMFYQRNLVVDGPLVSRAVLSIIYGEGDIFVRNSTLITLISKPKKPKTMSEFRPISICNVLYKLVTKVVVNQFQQVLPHSILETQGFSL